MRNDAVGQQAAAYAVAYVGLCAMARALPPGRLWHV